MQCYHNYNPNQAHNALMFIVFRKHNPMLLIHILPMIRMQKKYFLSEGQTLTAHDVNFDLV